MKLNPSFPATAAAVALIGGGGALAVTAVGVTASARLTGPVATAAPATVTWQPAGNTAVLDWSAGMGSVSGPQWTSYPATFISHMAAGPVIEGAALVRSFIIQLGTLVPTTPGSGFDSRGHAQLLTC